MPLPHAAATDIGQVRTRNEDTFVASPNVGLFAVVDGMGGHAHGDRAARLVADAVGAFVAWVMEDRDRTWPDGLDPSLSLQGNCLRAAVTEANRHLHQAALADRDLDGSGATIVAALIRPGHATVANVGDCRAYLVHGSECGQITRDHSIVGEQISAGLLNAEGAREHPLRHVVTRAVSGRPGLEVDIHEVDAVPGDRLVLCSDGVHGPLDQAELTGLLTVDGGSLDDTCRRVLDAVGAHGAPDNATMVITALA